jgi:organic radical activating enzyme
MLESPELFIKPKELEITLKKLNQDGQIIPNSSLSIRGGEPSLHPLLTSIINLTSDYFETVYLETHARWLLNSSSFQDSDRKRILSTCAERNVIIKISFDSMHGLTLEQLKEITNTLSKSKIRWVVAITERSINEMERVKASCSWISDENFIFQLKAQSIDELIKPILGVVKVNGKINSTLSNVFQKNDKKTIDIETVLEHV